MVVRVKVFRLRDLGVIVFLLLGGVEAAAFIGENGAPFGRVRVVIHVPIGLRVVQRLFVVVTLRLEDATAAPLHPPFLS